MSDPLRNASVALYLLVVPVVLPFFALLVGVGSEVAGGGSAAPRVRGARLLGAAVYSVVLGLGGFALVFFFGPWAGYSYGPPVDPPLAGFRYRLPGGPLWHGLLAPLVFLAAHGARRAFLRRVGVPEDGRHLALVPLAALALLAGALAR